MLRTMVLVRISVACLLAQSPSTDVDGWTKAKWGMTEAELAEAFKGEIKLLERPTAIPEPLRNRLKLDPSARELILGIESVRIGRFDYRVEFQFDDKKRLDSVIIRLQTDTLKSVAFIELKNFLTDKYGPPLRSEKEDDRLVSKETTTWLLPSTAISLGMFEPKIAGINGFVMVGYRQRKGSDKL